jgi:tRNA threonylcarbamoyladenosine biosynthesis protein TsaE
MGLKTYCPSDRKSHTLSPGGQKIDNHREVLVLRSEAVATTEDIGAAVASLLRPSDVVILSGELGAGKTAFSRGLGRQLGVVDPITSPTFTIMREHSLVEGGLLLHLDAYRLAGPDDADEIGLPELLDRGAIAVIEWGERIVDALGPDHLLLRFHHHDGSGGHRGQIGGSDESDSDLDNCRLIEVEGIGPRWTAVDIAATGSDGLRSWIVSGSSW